MRKILPEFITFTGIDSKTNLSDVVSLSRRYPVEWGILFRGGNSPRGMSERDRTEAIEYLTEKSVRLSAHLCGKYASAWVNREEPVQITEFDRVQINKSSYTEDEIDSIKMEAVKQAVQPIIQWREESFPKDGHVKNVQLLLDRSGGRGVTETSFPKHPRPDAITIGYAGGIGPDNVKDVILKLEGKYWIDMESKVRTEDLLDLDKCESVLRQVYDE